MARWATLIEQRRDERPVLLVDTGNFCPRERSKNQDELDLLFFEAMRLMRYDALAVGASDILYGKRRLLEQADRSRLELVSANLYDKQSGEPFTRPYVIREIGGTNLLFTRVGALKVGIFSVLQPALLYTEDPITREYYELEDPRTAALRTASELRKQGCDLVIALSQQVWDQSVTLAETVPGIDLIISSHRIHAKTQSEEHGGTLLVGPGEKLTSFPEISGSWAGGRWELAAVDRGPEIHSLPDHPEFSRIEKKYQAASRPKRIEE